MEFVIIGGDAAGMSAASRAKRPRPDLKVTVLEKTTDVSYSACGMPYNIADPKRKIEDLVVRGADIFRAKQDIHLLTGHCAKAIDRINKSVIGTSLKGKNFEFSFDKLLIATGASPIIPDLPGLNLPGVMQLKNLDDGRKIKQFIKLNRVKKSVVIGMGFIALEMVEALRALNIEVCMVKSRPVFLPWMDETLADVVKGEVETNRVRLYPGHVVEN